MSRRSRAVTLVVVLAIACMVVHFFSGWAAYEETAASHGEAAAWGPYLVEWIRDVFENLQSEFWQLAVQFALLAGLLRWIGVTAYEEDIEDLKDRLGGIETQLGIQTEDVAYESNYPLPSDPPEREQ